MILLLLVGFLTRIVMRYGLDNSPVIYANYLHIMKEYGVNII